MQSHTQGTIMLTIGMCAGGIGDHMYVHNHSAIRAI